MKTPELNRFAEHCQQRTEAALERFLPSEKTLPVQLHQAMRYAVLDGGKRIRPLLVYAAGQATGASEDALDIAACSVECIHSYSLLHDDLPAMDNDDLRRGKPTCHKAFDEATAILAGDALQSLAFQVLSRAPQIEGGAEIRLQMIEQLALASGSRNCISSSGLKRWRSPHPACHAWALEVVERSDAPAPDGGTLDPRWGCRSPDPQYDNDEFRRGDADAGGRQVDAAALVAGVPGHGHPLEGEVGGVAGDAAAVDALLTPDAG